MGCFLGCFGGAKDHKRRKQRVHRASPHHQRIRVQNVQQENTFTAGQTFDVQNVQQENTLTAEQTILETRPSNLAPDINKPEVEEQSSPSPKKRVTFNSNITAYEPVPVNGSVDSLPGHNVNVADERQESLQTSSQSHSVSEDNNSVTSSVASYPPNHRYHNARDSDDEAEEYGASDLDDDLDYLDDEDDDYDDRDVDIDVGIASQEVWSESSLTASMESRTGNPSSQAINEEVESPLVKNRSLHQEIMAFGSKAYARDRSDYINSVLNPVENITQWKAAKSKGARPLKPQKENLTAKLEAPLECDQYSLKSKADQMMNANQDIAVDASLSNWLFTPEITSCKKSDSSGQAITSGMTASEGCISVSSFEDRPILGALTVQELRQISASPSPRKSPSRSPDEMPIIGTVGTYWNDMASIKHCHSASSYKGIPNTTSKYREDKRVNWHSTPFETRLDRALKHGAAEA